MPAVSVIVPNFNHAKYLDERFNSIFSQTFSDFEVIILDDCSTDHSRDVIETYRSHEKVSHVVFNKINSGSTFRQWAKGIELAKGKYVWIAESDDWCEPQFLETLMYGIQPNTSLAFAQSLVVDESGKVLWNTKADYYEEQLEGPAFVRSKMLSGNAITNASMCIFRKDFYYKINPDFTTYKFCGDWLFWIEMSLLGSVLVSGKILNYFRKHTADVSGGAYRSGIFYREFFLLVDALKRKYIVDDIKAKEMLLRNFIVFLKDVKLERKLRPALTREFKLRLGSQAYRAMLDYRIFKLKRSWKGFL